MASEHKIEIEFRLLYRIFQVGNLEYASPATVARVGVVFVDAAELSIEPAWHRWLQQRNDNEHEWLQVFYLGLLLFT